MRVLSACFALAVLVAMIYGCRDDVPPAIEERPLLVPRGEAPRMPPPDPFPPPPKLPRVPARRERTFAANADRLVFTPDGKRLLVGNAGALTLHSTSGKTRRFFGNVSQSRTSGTTGFLAVSPDGRLLLTAGSRIQLRDGRTGKLLRDLDEVDDYTDPAHAAFSPDSNLLASEGVNVIRLWQVPQGRLLRVLRDPDRQSEDMLLPTFAPNGRWLAVAKSASYPDGPAAREVRVALYDTRSWRIQRTLADCSGLYALSFSPEGKRLAASLDEWPTPELHIVLLDVTNGKEIARKTIPPDLVEAETLLFHSSGGYLAAISHDGLWFWDLKKDRIEVLPLPVPVAAFSFSPDGKRVALACRTGEIQIWRLLERGTQRE